MVGYPVESGVGMKNIRKVSTPVSKRVSRETDVCKHVPSCGDMAGEMDGFMLIGNIQKNLTMTLYLEAETMDGFYFIFENCRKRMHYFCA